VTRK